MKIFNFPLFALALSMTACGSSFSPTNLEVPSTPASPDISVDSSFGSTGVLRHFFSGEADSTTAEVTKILPLSTGQILVLANTKSTSKGLRVSVSRWNSTGTALDASFASGQAAPGIIEFDLGSNRTEAHDLTLQSDGSILIAGRIYDSAATTSDEAFVLRLTAEGVLDTNFGTSGIFRSNFSQSWSAISAIKVASDDSILFTGWVSNDQTAFQTLTGKLNSSGALDITFDTDGSRIIDYSASPDFDSDNTYGDDLLITTAGKIYVIVGAYDNNNGTGSGVITRLNSNGSDDTDFSADGHLQFQNNNYFVPIGAALTSDEKIILLADTTDQTETDALSVVYRISSNGSMDTDFGTSGKITIIPEASFLSYSGGLELTSQDEVVVSGLFFGSDFGLGKLYIQKFTADGTSISTANSGTFYTYDTLADFDEFVYASALDSNGKLLVAGREQPIGAVSQYGYVGRFSLPGIAIE